MSKSVNASWPAEAGATGYQAEYRPPSGSWTRFYSGSATVASITVYADGDYGVRVRALQGSLAGPWREGLATVAGATTALSAVLSTATASASGVQVPLYTAAVSAIATGGTPGYQYAWERLTGSGRVLIGSPSAATTLFSGSPAVDETLTETFRCRVSDAAGAVAYTGTLTVSLTGVAYAVPSVTGLALADNGDSTATLTWDPVTDPYVTSIQIRHAPETGGAAWADAVVLLTVEPRVTAGKVPLLIGTYLVKARAGSAESTAAAAVVNSTPGALEKAAPIGEFTWWPKGAAPPGGTWLLADGSTLHYDDWPRLGAWYGAAPGGTFAIRDMRNLPAWGHGDEAIGDVVGEDRLDLTHDHAAGTLATASHAHAAGALATGGSGTLTTGAPSAATAGLTPALMGGTPAATDSHTHTVASHTHAITGSTASASPAISGSTDAAQWTDAAGDLADPAAVDRRPARAIGAWYQRAAL